MGNHRVAQTHNHTKRKEKKMKKLILTALVVVLVPVAALAMDHSKMAMDNDAKKMDHGGMKDMVMLADQTTDGVKATGHLMAGGDGHGQELMLMFVDATSGAMISKGQVAVKVTSPDGKVGEAQRMTLAKGMFSAPVMLMAAGDYTFTVGTKLADGQKRTFVFPYTK